MTTFPTNFPRVARAATTFARRAVLDAVSSTPGTAPRRERLRAAVSWLKRAQDATQSGGVSQGYYLWREGRSGWLEPYRETSGYIVETMFDAAQALDDPDSRRRAMEVASWLLSVQNEDGSFSNPRFGPTGIVFDTGQALFGLVRAFRESNEQRFLDAALRTGAWLTARVDEDGAFRRNTYRSCVHTYNTRTAWAMLCLSQVAADSTLEGAARRSLDWAVAQEHAGWFRSNAFTSEGVPFTHNIAYAIRGLLESSLLLGTLGHRHVAERAAQSTLAHVRPSGFIPGQIDYAGRARSSSCCLTGNCQLAIIWFKLARLTGDRRYSDAATSSLRYVEERQDVFASDPGVRGGVPGSYPIYGRYSGLGYPNWATKFFVDAILLAEQA